MVSIIVPVYNASKTIDRCLTSILAQTACDREIILVNDGSCDDSLKIITRYSENHPEIRIIDKKNGGVSSARNAGLVAASGEYVTFIDSDDFYTDNNYISNMLSKMEEDEKCDLVVSGFTVLTNTTKKAFSSSEKTVTAYELARDFYPEYKSGNLMNSACNKLFKIEKINAQFGEKLTMGEDAVFVLEYLKGCNRITFCNQVGYGYIFMNTSTTADFRKSIPYDIVQTNIYHSAILAFWRAFLPETTVAADYLRMRTDAVLTMARSVISKKGLFHFFTYDISDMLFDENFSSFNVLPHMPKSYQHLRATKYVVSANALAVKIYTLSDIFSKKLKIKNKKADR